MSAESHDAEWTPAERLLLAGFDEQHAKAELLACFREHLKGDPDCLCTACAYGRIFNWKRSDS